MRFKQFISEDRSWAYTPEEVSATTLIEWCEQNAPMYMKRLSQFPIWRGMDAPAMGLIDTNNMNRTSANTHNYYTIWMDNHPDWRDYPKRSKSLICSTNHHTAENFGMVQLIIPADINSIGICSDNDLWGSFPFLFGQLGNNYIADLSDFVSVMHRIMQLAGDYSDNELVAAEKSYPDLINILKSVTVDKIKGLPEKDDRRGLAHHLVTIMEKRQLQSLYSLWEDGMQPEENDFSLTKAAKFKKTGDHEVWVQGKCATIDVSYLEGVFLKDNREEHPIYQFFSEHNVTEDMLS